MGQRPRVFECQQLGFCSEPGEPTAQTRNRLFSSTDICTAIIELTVRRFGGVPEIGEGIPIVEPNGEEVQHRHPQRS